MKRLILVLLIVAFAAHPLSALEFGWHPGSHGTAQDMGASTWSNVGSLNKALVYFAGPGDVLDSIGLWSLSNDGAAESLRVYVYELTGDLGTLGARVLVDTIGPITTGSAATYKIDVNYAFTAKTFYTLAVDTFTASGGGFIDRYITTTGTAAVMVPQTAGEDGESKTAPGASPWGAEGTNNTSFHEIWGVVTPGSVTGTRNKVTFVSDWDTTSGTGTNDTLIARPPTGLSSGDVLIAMIMKGDDLAGSSITESAGWRILHEGTSTAGDDQMLGIYWRVYTGSAPESLFVFSAAETFSGGIAAFRNVDTTSFADCSPFTNYILDVTGNDPINRSVTTRTDSSMVVMFATASTTDTGTVTTPTGTTNLWARKGGSATAFNASFAAYDLKETAGATGDYTWGVNDASATDAHTFIVALRPKAEAEAGGANSKITGPGIVWIVDGKPDKWWSE